MKGSKNILVFSLVLLFFCISLLHAQELSKVSVEIVADVEDSVGCLLIDNIKELIENSSTIRLTESAEPRLKIMIMTIPKYKAQPDSATIYSVSCLLSDIIVQQVIGLTYPLFITCYLGYCETEDVESSAKQIVTEIIDLAEEYRIIFSY